MIQARPKDFVWRRRLQSMWLGWAPAAATAVPNNSPPRQVGPEGEGAAQSAIGAAHKTILRCTKPHWWGVGIG